MLKEDFYHGDQGECFKKLEKHHVQISHEFNSQKNILSQDEIKTRIKNIEDEVQKFNSERKNLINEYEIKKKKGHRRIDEKNIAFIRGIYGSKFYRFYFKSI